MKDMCGLHESVIKLKDYNSILPLKGVVTTNQHISPVILVCL